MLTYIYVYDDDACSALDTIQTPSVLFYTKPTKNVKQGFSCSTFNLPTGDNCRGGDKLMVDKKA